jgi:hypothetical protein
MAVQPEPKKADEAKLQDARNPEPTIPAHLDKYHKVRFHNKANANDPEYITLTVNDERIVCQRGKDTIIPERFKECADNAVSDHFEDDGESDRKVRTTMMAAPYLYLGEATKEEYLRMKREGTAATRAKMERDAQKW